MISPLLGAPGFRGVDLGRVADAEHEIGEAARPSGAHTADAGTPAHSRPRTSTGAHASSSPQTSVGTEAPPARPQRIDLTQYDQEPPAARGEDGLTDEERTGQYRTGPIDPNRPMAPRRLMRGGEQLSVMVGQRLLVGITFLDESGNITNAQQFCGLVLEVADGVVVVERPGEPEPAVLPADVAAYRKAQSGRYTLRDTGEIVVDPDFVSTWRVAAVD